MRTVKFFHYAITRRFVGLGIISGLCLLLPASLIAQKEAVSSCEKKTEVPCTPHERRCHEGVVWICNGDGQSWRQALCGAETVCLEGECGPVTGQWLEVRAWQGLPAHLPLPPGRSLAAASAPRANSYRHRNGLLFRFEKSPALSPSQTAAPLRLIVRFSKMLDQTEEKNLARLGITRLGAYDSVTALLNIPARSFAQFRRFGFVAFYSPWSALDKVSEDILHARARATSVTPEGLLRMRCHFFAEVARDSALVLFKDSCIDDQDWKARHVLTVALSPRKMSDYLESKLIYWIE